MTDCYAVFGNPIAQSKSPTIHKLFAQQTGQEIDYSKKLVELDCFAHELQQFFDNGGCGINITLPFKQQAWQLLDDCSDEASDSRAVNTVILQPNGDLYGANTDGVGLLRDMQENLQWQIRGQRILIIGAGGAARGVVPALLNAEPAELGIVNRSEAKAHGLQADMNNPGAVQVYTREQLSHQSFDIVINTTSASLAGEVPDVPDTIIASHSKAYDLFYAEQATVFMNWAQSQGAQAVADGLGMLVEQAAESFYLWRGVRPGTQSVIQALRDDMRR